MKEYIKIFVAVTVTASLYVAVLGGVMVLNLRAAQVSCQQTVTCAIRP